MSIDEKAAKALAHRGKPKGTLARLTDEERFALATIWDNHGETLGPEFELAFGEVWEKHSKRWAKLLEANKATASDDADVTIEEATAVDE